MIGRARCGEPASVGSRNFVDSECTNDLLGEIDITLQIPPITWNFPNSTLARALTLLQPEVCENLVDCFRFDRDPDDAIAFFVVERNVCRMCRNFSSRSNFFRRCSTRDLMDPFARSLRCSQKHSRINAALKAITRIAR